MKLLNISFLLLFFTLFSCKEKESPKINPCANGVKDNGEEEVDCGGTCTQCYHYPYIIYNAFGKTIQTDTKSITYTNGQWILYSKSDSLYFFLNLGSDGNVGIYNITATNSYANINNLHYAFVKGVIGISYHNTVSKTMSGNFDATFVNSGNIYDTLKIESGQFEYLPY